MKHEVGEDDEDRSEAQKGGEEHEKGRHGAAPPASLQAVLRSRPGVRSLFRDTPALAFAPRSFSKVYWKESIATFKSLSPSQDLRAYCILGRAQPTCASQRTFSRL